MGICYFNSELIRKINRETNRELDSNFEELKKRLSQIETKLDLLLKQK